MDFCPNFKKKDWVIWYWLCINCCCIAITYLRILPDQKVPFPVLAKMCRLYWRGLWTTGHTQSVERAQLQYKHHEFNIEKKKHSKSRQALWHITVLLPELRNRRRNHTRSGPAWRRSSCRRSNAGSDTCGSRTSVRAPTRAAEGTETERRSNPMPEQPASPPDHWGQHRCEQLRQRDTHSGDHQHVKLKY